MVLAVTSAFSDADTKPSTRGSRDSAPRGRRFLHCPLPGGWSLPRTCMVFTLFSRSCDNSLGCDHRVSSQLQAALPCRIANAGSGIPQPCLCWRAVHEPPEPGGVSPVGRAGGDGSLEREEGPPSLLPSCPGAFLPGSLLGAVHQQGCFLIWQDRWRGGGQMHPSPFSLCHLQISVVSRGLCLFHSLYVKHPVRSKGPFVNWRKDDTVSRALLSRKVCFSTLVTST